MTPTPNHAHRSQPRWNTWGDRLVGLGAVGVALALAHAWMTQYANPQGNGFFSQKLSGPIEDLMPNPPNTAALQPLVGYHYFSDLQLAIAYGKTANPYLIDYPAQYPPIGILEFRLLGLFGYQAGLWLFLLGAIGILGFVGWRLMGEVSRSRKLVNLLVLVILTPAMVMAVDRGALSPIATGMVGLAFLAAQRRRMFVAGVVLLLAISLKPYLALVLLYPLLRGYWKFVLKTAAATALINLAAFALFLGSFLNSFNGFINATLRYADSTAAADQATTVKFVTLDSVSGTGTILRVITFWKNIDVASMIYDNYVDFVLLPGLLFLIALIIILLNRHLPFWIPLTLTLATSTVVFPATPLYTLTWASLAAFYFGSSNSDPFPRTSRQDESGPLDRTWLRIAYLVAIALCLVPTFWLIPGIESGNQTAAGLLGPLAILIAAALTLGSSLWDFIQHRRQALTG
mgnify:CR=1 FL=1